MLNGKEGDSVRIDATTGGGGFNTFAFLSFLLSAFNAVRKIRWQANLDKSE